MIEAEYLLSDNFVEFSKKVAMIHAKKQELSEDMKVIYQKFQNDCKLLDAEVMSLQQEFEAWRQKLVMNTANEE